MLQSPASISVKQEEEEHGCWSDDSYLTQAPHHEKLLRLPICKIRTVSQLNVRTFWFKYLKPELIINPLIKMSSIFQELAKLKDVSIKKLLHLVYEDEEKFKAAQYLYKEILEIFRRHPHIEKLFPIYVSKLRVWFERVLALADFEEFQKNETIPHKPKKTRKKKILNRASRPPSKNVTIPAEYLIGLQNQISFLMAQLHSVTLKNNGN
jgi:hypothetical protein